MNVITTTQHIYDTLRLAEAPMSTQEVVDELLKIGIRRDKTVVNATIQAMIQQGKVYRSKFDPLHGRNVTTYQVGPDVPPGVVDAKKIKDGPKIELIAATPQPEAMPKPIPDPEPAIEVIEIVKIQETTATNVDAVLAERGSRYGSFTGHAEITQCLKNQIAGFAQQRDCILADDQREALEMICHKIARIINGDPDYADSWIDIAGYAKLVADRLSKESNSG